MTRERIPRLYWTNRLGDAGAGCDVCRRQGPAFRCVESDASEPLHWCWPCAEIRDRLPWGVTPPDTKRAADELIWKDQGLAAQAGERPFYHPRRVAQVAEVVRRLTYRPPKDYLVVYRPDGGGPAVPHGRYDSEEDALRHAASLRHERTAVGSVVVGGGSAVVQKISGLRMTSDGRRYLREMGLDPRNL